MKKTLLVIAALVAFGCSKVEQPQATQSVTFKVGDITSDKITKATMTQFLRDIQPHSQPTLTIESTSDKSYYVTVEAGTSIDLPVGEYRITATYEKSIIGSVGGRPISEEPIYGIDETVTVQAGKSLYYLTGYYRSWALVIDYTSTDHYLCDANNFNFVRGDENRKGVLFVSTIEPGSQWPLIAYPKDNALYDAVIYTIGDNDAGYWYCYSPTAKEQQSGVFCVNLPDWIEHQ